jgi:hypothetical protein
MPLIRPPVNGFLSLLTGAENFSFHFEQIAIHSSIKLGLIPEFDPKRLQQTLEVWRETFAMWPWPNENEASTSHIKMAGALLWSILQEDCCPIDEVVEIRTNHKVKLEKFGASDRIRQLAPGRGDILRASPNPSIGYIVVTSIFNTIQRARNITRAGIDFDNPPLTKHYFQNLACWYLVSKNPSVEDLYMIYKTMDLYALNHPLL